MYECMQAEARVLILDIHLENEGGSRFFLRGEPRPPRRRWLPPTVLTACFTRAAMASSSGSSSTATTTSDIEHHTIRFFQGARPDAAANYELLSHLGRGACACPHRPAR